MIANRQRSVFSLAAATAIALLGRTAFGQIKFTLGFKLETLDGSPLPCGGAIQGSPGSRVRFWVFPTLTQADFEVGKGASGFSIGFRTENVDLIGRPGASIKNKPPDGDQTTASSGAKCGTGQVVIPLPDFFCSATILELGPQGEGYADGLAFEIGLSLEGNGTFVIGRVQAEATIPDTGSKEARFLWADVLLGESVSNNAITSGGKTVKVDSGRLTLADCRLTLEVLRAPQRPGDADQDGAFELNDVEKLLSHLFHGDPAELPCESKILYSPGNRKLLDANGDGEVDISDCIHDLYHLFLGGPAHVLGAACVEISGCPPNPRCL